jgi:hypothetical protein
MSYSSFKSIKSSSVYPYGTDIEAMIFFYVTLQ